MEQFILCSMPLAVLIILFVLTLCLLFLKPTSAKQTLRLPPGPWNLPVIGSLHCLIGTSLPHHAMRDLSRRYGPLMFLKLGEVPTLVVSSAEAAKEVMKTHDMAFASRHLSVTIGILSSRGTDILFSPYNNNWKQLRKICVLELLSAKRVQSFRSIREDEVARLVRSISSSSGSSHPVNLSEKISMLVNDTIVRAAIGNRCKQQGEFLHELDEAVRLIGGFNLADLFPSSRVVRLLSSAARDAERCYQKVQCILQSIIQDRNNISGGEMAGGSANAEDLLGVLLTLHKEGGLHFALTTDIIRLVILNVFSAGSETSSTTLEWAMSELVKNPRLLEKAQSEVRRVVRGRAKLTEEDLGELTYLKLVLKETLRLHPPAPFLLPRECREACQLMGYDIPEGTQVLVNAWAICRDHKYWEDAQEFKPVRFERSTIDFKGTDFEFIPFGAGRRMCPGISLGLANIELALASLLYHFDWKLPAGMKPQELDMVEALGITARRKSKLWLHPIVQIPYPTL